MEDVMTLRVRQLRLEVREANERADAATKEFEKVAGYLVAFYENLRAISPHELMQDGVSNAMTNVPCLSTWIKDRQSFIQNRDQQLRNEALLKMTLEQARAMGFVVEWRMVHHGLSAKDQRFQEAMGAAGFPNPYPDDRDGIGGPAD